MALKNQKPFTIPEGFSEVLKSFTREVLRSQVCAGTTGSDPARPAKTCNWESVLVQVYSMRSFFLTFDAT